MARTIINGVIVYYDLKHNKYFMDIKDKGSYEISRNEYLAYMQESGKIYNNHRLNNIINNIMKKRGLI